MPDADRGEKIESTSFSTLRDSELPPKDLLCFGFSFAIMTGLTSDKWLGVLLSRGKIY